MSEKIYVRKCEKYTIWEATKPIEVNVEKLRQCEPPYTGSSNEELFEYLKNEVFSNYDWAEVNGRVYGEDEAYELTFDESPDSETYSDSREKYADDWYELGVPNEEYRKVGKFESYMDNMQRNDW